MNKIETVVPTIVRVPLQRPVRSAVRRADHLVAVLVRVRTEDGDGVGFVSAFTPDIARGISALVEELARSIRGVDSSNVEEISSRMHERLRLIGTSGPSLTAVAGVDIALWDLLGKLRGVPVHSLLGTRHDALDVYASDGCWLVTSHRVVEEATAAVSAGFRTIKVRAGRQTLDADLEILRRVRATVGNDAKLIVDANQAWDIPTVERAAPELSRLSVSWLEEPILAYDFDGYDELAKNVDVPLAAGESLFGPGALARLVSGGAIHMLTPDLQRVGGVTGWLETIKRTESHVPLVSAHLYPEFSSHLLAACTRPGPVEWVSWAQVFAMPPVRPRNGRLGLAEEPGFGITYDWDAVARFALAP